MIEKPVLSVVVPSIRINNIIPLYDSLKQATKVSTELIVISPYSMPPNIWDLGIKWFVDYGSASRCQQIGGLLAEGKYITWMADDGIFEPNILQNMIEFLDSQKYDDIIISGKYFESDRTKQPDSYYKLVNAYPAKPWFNKDWWILNFGVMDRSIWTAMGGWDAKFETTCFAHADLALRINNVGNKIILWPDEVAAFTHEPNTTGTHAPVHYSFIEHDTPYWNEKWEKQPISIQDFFKNVIIKLDNWKDTPPIYKRRFH